MAYIQNISAFIPNGSSRCLAHSNQCDEINCSVAKQFEDAEGYAQRRTYNDHYRPICDNVSTSDALMAGFAYLLVLFTRNVYRLYYRTLRTTEEEQRRRKTKLSSARSKNIVTGTRARAMIVTMRKKMTLRRRLNKGAVVNRGGMKRVTRMTRTNRHQARKRILRS